MRGHIAPPLSLCRSCRRHELEYNPVAAGAAKESGAQYVVGWCDNHIAARPPAIQANAAGEHRAELIKHSFSASTHLECNAAGIGVPGQLRDAEQISL